MKAQKARFAKTVKFRKDWNFEKNNQPELKTWRYYSQCFVWLQCVRLVAFISNYKLKRNRVTISVFQSINVCSRTSILTFFDDFISGKETVESVHTVRVEMHNQTVVLWPYWFLWQKYVAQSTTRDRVIFFCCDTCKNMIFFSMLPDVLDSNREQPNL